MRFRALLGGCVLAVVAADGLAAQACIGTASFASGPVRVGGAFTVGDHVKGYGLQLEAGATNGLFAGAALSRNDYDNVSASGTNTAVNAGYAINLTPQRNLQVCPVVGYDYQRGPDLHTVFGTAAANSRAGTFGGSLGGVVPVSPTLDFVPFAGVSYLVTRSSAYGGGISSSLSQNYEAVDVGAGFVINRMLTLRPSVAVPVGLKGGKSAFEADVAYSFGRMGRH